MSSGSDKPFHGKPHENTDCWYGTLSGLPSFCYRICTNIDSKHASRRSRGTAAPSSSAREILSVEVGGNSARDEPQGENGRARGFVRQVKTGNSS